MSAKQILLIDNYDSFTFNLVQRLGELGAECEVVRNDALTVDEIVKKKPQRIVLSPGPCTPAEAGVCVPLLRRLAGKDGQKPLAIPTLGVCLGHQSLGAALGAKVIRAKAPVHGKASAITHDKSALFEGAAKTLEVGRYHSLIVEEKSLPKELKVSARTSDGVVMALRHATLPLFGLQFHPESILTPDGQLLLGNFLRVRSGKVGAR
ncbi:MAG: aminodeoxychorismate/anthranilate synthase component II [Deltaproteobacteria bacterium]|nr:aminodeoxychorismate/anthranilate synthase component II [Deltaproteobacteria bacterium]